MLSFGIKFSIFFSNSSYSRENQREYAKCIEFYFLKLSIVWNVQCDKIEPIECKLLRGSAFRNGARAVTSCHWHRARYPYKQWWWSTGDILHTVVMNKHKAFLYRDDKTSSIVKETTMVYSHVRLYHYFYVKSTLLWYLLLLRGTGKIIISAKEYFRLK